MRWVKRLALPVPGQWYGMKTVSGRIVFTTMAGSVTQSRRVCTVDPISVADSVLLRQAGMDFHSRPGILIDESANPAGLRAGQILAYHAAGGEVDRVLLIYGIAWRPPRGHFEMRFLVTGVKLHIFEQTRRPRVFRRGTGPEHAFHLVHLFVGDAVIVGYSAAGGLRNSSRISAGVANGKYFAFPDDVPDPR